MFMLQEMDSKPCADRVAILMAAIGRRASGKRSQEKTTCTVHALIASRRVKRWKLLLMVSN
jgi:hypothetical protein